VQFAERQSVGGHLGDSATRDTDSTQVAQSRHFMRGSILLLSIRVFCWMFLVETLYAGVLFGLTRSPGLIPEAIAFNVLWALHTVKFVFLVVVTLKLVTDWATTTYYLANHHLVKYHGIFEVDEAIYELQSLKSLHLKESIVGRLLNYGDIYLTLSSSGYREDVVLCGISHARRYERVLRDYLKQNAGRATPLELEPGVLQTS
jgi:uncharacterized membrane protein YdbT with pleckstrin-like domain